MTSLLALNNWRSIENLFFLDPLQRQKLTVLETIPARLRLSFDAGRSETETEITPAGLVLPQGKTLPLPPPELLRLSEERTILIFKDNQWQKWQHFDPQSGKFYKMVFVAPGKPPRGKPPTVEISGIKMHVTKEGDPALDTRNKLRALGPFRGRALDSCCGLGYSAIALAGLKGVKEVVTIEKDPVMLALCRENPWSRELFDSEKIRLIPGDAAEIIAEMPERSFAAILHDPPRFALAPELYREEFYRECWRVLQQRGKLYHYTGDPNQAHRSSLPERTMERLRKVGFRKVVKAYQGVVAQKGTSRDARLT